MGEQHRKHASLQDSVKIRTYKACIFLKYFNTRCEPPPMKNSKTIMRAFLYPLDENRYSHAKRGVRASREFAEPILTKYPVVPSPPVCRFFQEHWLPHWLTTIRFDVLLRHVPRVYWIALCGRADSPPTAWKPGSHCRGMLFRSAALNSVFFRKHCSL